MQASPPSIPTTSQQQRQNRQNPSDDGEKESVNIESIKNGDDEKKDGAPLRSPTPPATTAGKKKQKNGHRRVDRSGGVSYKRVPTNALMLSMQMGIAKSLQRHANEPMGDGVPVRPQDFQTIENVSIPASEGGSRTTTFKTFAPVAFRYFRERLFGIDPNEFRRSLCVRPLTELANPGASGSVFYVSEDGDYIIKTVSHEETELLRKLLPGYMAHRHQNPRTLLPMFFGLFCYQTTRGKNIGLLVMNNLLPRTIQMHRKFDLKGSTFLRRASQKEWEKRNPTLKDLDFDDWYEDGIALERDDRQKMMEAIAGDCAFLESANIMDYSLLVGIHLVVVGGGAPRQQEEERFIDEENEQQGQQPTELLLLQPDGDAAEKKIDTAKSSLHFFHPRGIPAVNGSTGDRLLIFLGIIDILQSYGLRRRLEHAAKSVLRDGAEISVAPPPLYAERFQQYIGSKVFPEEARREKGDGEEAET